MSILPTNCSYLQPQTLINEIAKYGVMEKYLMEEVLKAEALPKLFRLRERFQAVLENIPKDPDGTHRRDTMYGLINILTQWSEIRKTHHLYTPKRILYEVKLGSLLKKMIKGATSRMTVEDTNSHLVDCSPDYSDDFRWSPRFFVPTRVHGLDEKVRFMERLLQKKSRKEGTIGSIAIVGIPGVGKTTLCQVMFNNDKVKTVFQLRIWVCLSKQKNEDPDRKKEVLKRILICLGTEDGFIESMAENEVDGLGSLIFLLRKQLKGRKFLIVLDDASETDDFFQNLSGSRSESNCFKKLSDGFPKEKGGMVVVTTRSEEVAVNMVGEGDVHHLLPLKDKEDCWEIFKDTVEKDGKIKYPEEHMDLKEFILAKCSSIPLAAKMMGEIMHQQLTDRAFGRSETRPHQNVQLLTKSQTF